ncbi:HNH endonuclease [Paracidovorax avenae]|uniref:HNH endonuclease n=1 Tax=Paracidovorax avenae TaxID=80867 RepID=UPI000D216903|nr:HNH endonuclease [Paracidovorax avenae]AVS85857.1 HNH endonuclease [Paracidovorax avenae]
MALYLLKPVLWNTAGYHHPSGVRAGGFPGDNGFGHEEWNNSPRMWLREGGQDYRVFHTEGVGLSPVDEHAGQTFVFMTASHDGVQQLVGVAGNAWCLAGDHHRTERERLSAVLQLQDLWKEAWDVPRVREKFAGRSALQAHFRQDLHWIPNWLCPDEMFLWFETPVTLNSQHITGSSALPKMFSKYMALQLPAATRVMNSVPVHQRTPTWHGLMAAMNSAPDEPIVSAGDDALAVTTRLAATLARCGQGAFRNSLLRRWEGLCAVTGLSCAELLIASHIQPWSTSTSRERLDVDNGLLLAAHLDRLFDKGLISFDDDGGMLLSASLGQVERKHFGLPLPLRVSPTERMRHYLKVHRETLFRR